MNRIFIYFRRAIVFSLSSLLFAQISFAAYVTPPIKLRRPLDILPSPLVNFHVDNNTTAAEKDYKCGSKTYNGHKGTDFKGTLGTPIYSSAPGRVYYRYDECDTIGYWGNTCGNAFGNHVRMDHEGNWNDGIGMVTIYAHMTKGTPAFVMDYPCGTKVGKIGSSGWSTAPHLHFQVNKTGYPKDDPFTGPCGGGLSFWNNIDANGVPSTQCSSSYYYY